MRLFFFFLAAGIAFFVGRVLEAPTHAPTPVRKAPPIAAAPQHRIRSKDEVLVLRAIDGDTIALEGGARVRYIGVDTPETKDPRKPVQCFGKRAFEKNRDLVEGKLVRLARDISDRDRYGRLLRYVYVGDIFVNLRLVEEGFAKSYSYPPDIAKQAEFRAAERRAREAGIGLWGECAGN